MTKQKDSKKKHDLYVSVKLDVEEKQYYEKENE
jgi:hypothetical protein